MNLKDKQEMLAFQRQAEAQGKLLSQVLEEEIRKEEQRQADQDAARIKVQIMPHNVVAGYGKFPAVVLMPEEKATHLAHMGTVKIILDDKDVIKDNDTVAIQEHTDEMMAIRRSAEKLPQQEPNIKPARLTNVIEFEKEKERQQRKQERQGAAAAATGPVIEGQQEEAQARESRWTMKG